MIERIWGRRRRGALQAISEHLDAQNALLREIRTELRRQRREITGKDRRRLEGILVNSLADGMRTELRCFARERMLGMRETLERLARENVGFARFGDGEFLLMLREPFSLRFQSNSHALQAALRDVFTRSTPDLMVGFPHLFQTLHWTNVWSDVWSEVKELVPESVVFGDSHVTRPIFFEMFREEGVDLWRRVWADKKVTVVAGEGGRFSLVDPLFDSASDIDIAWSVPVDAFEDLDRLVDELTRQRRDLYLLSLGPAATVLARRLADAGLRAIDIGHLSDSYRATFDGAELPEYRPVVTGDSEGTPNRRG